MDDKDKQLQELARSARIAQEVRALEWASHYLSDEEFQKRLEELNKLRDGRA
jgi:hypothetical protein